MMAEGVDQAERAFGREVAPQSEQPRDQGGRFVQTTGRPEPVFADRATEGDDAGDTRDAGDDQGLRAREREIADGWIDEGSRDKAADRSRAKDARHASADERHARGQDESEDPDTWETDDAGNYVTQSDGGDEAEGGGRNAERSSERDAETFEVEADGAVHHVTLSELRASYSRIMALNQRNAQLTKGFQDLIQGTENLNREWTKVQEVESDLLAMAPKEPNWDQAFAENPSAAHLLQKEFANMYGRVQRARQERAAYYQRAAAENDRQVEKYAIDGFTKFVMDNKIPDEATLKKEIQSMRRTALNAGFSEQEVVTVYDSRMLSILRKASKYDRMMAARPRAQLTGKGRTLTPGSATPFGDAGRKSFDEAQRRLASSGRLDDATEVFRKML